MSTDVTGTATFDSAARSQLTQAELARALAAIVGISFLSCYMLFHALHVANRDPQIVQRLAPIAMFASCAASAITGLPLSCVVTVFAVSDPRRITRLPMLLAISTALFTAEILLFP